MSKLRGYGIEVRRYGLGNISATFPGGEPVEFLEVVTHDGGQMATGFREPCVPETRKEGEPAVDNLQLFPLMQVAYHVSLSLGGTKDESGVRRLIDFERRLTSEARTCLLNSGPEALKGNYGVTARELSFIEDLRDTLDSERL